MPKTTRGARGFPTVLLAVLLVAGCGAQPAPSFFGAARAEAVRGAHRYVLFRRGDRIEVIRLGYAAPGTHRRIRATMVALVTEMTGCRLSDYASRGDSGEIRGRLVGCRPGRWPLPADLASDRASDRVPGDGTGRYGRWNLYG